MLSLGISLVLQALLKEILKRAYQWFKDSAKKEYMPAQIQYYVCLCLGIGTAPDFKEAELYYQDIISSRAQVDEYRLGEALLKRGSSQAMARATVHFKSALIQGNSDAGFLLTLAYLNGWGVTINIKKALKFAEKSSVIGSLEAKLVVEILRLETTFLVNPDFFKTIEKSKLLELMEIMANLKEDDFLFKIQTSTLAMFG